MKKLIKYLAIVLFIAISLYNSIYIKDLDEIKAEKSKTSFNSKVFASEFIENKVSDLKAIEALGFLNEISKNVKSYSETHGNKLGISNDYYFIIYGNATVLTIEDEDVVVALAKSQQKLKIAIDFIFGNAIREGAKMANIGDYQNTMDYNNISVEINNLVRENIVPPFRRSVKIGDSIYFKGAVRVNVLKQKNDTLRVIPLQLNIKS
ncbi:hypothetical protein PK35_00490 [Tamlana nanhaiensis]|uniref:Periplasmic lipoprotein n=1 Tax=Neotamlana nanhaiensis TaxID=1382798 RepID=A0A0D7W5E7_9FLAO|nr:DUF2291 family protein [Tamlana nanhaiensis]KJD34335.1 hypothetical protein PK35_00490 [Tamlana nanhaiensis]